MMKNYSRLQYQKGMTLIEILFSILIFSIAILGLGAMQSKAMQKNSSAIYKSVAMNLANEMGDILRSQVFRPSENGNDQILSALDDVTIDGSKFEGNLKADNCASGCSGNALIKHYLASWEKKIGSELPMGLAVIKKVTVKNNLGGHAISSNAYEVTIMWDDRKLSASYNPSGTLGTQCSGDPSVDRACMKTTILP